jgi:hypothetical protein
MPTARELLEQADALMRRNRAGDTSIPVLTDVVEPPEPARAGPSTREGAGDLWLERAEAAAPARPAKPAQTAVAPVPPAGRQALSSEPPVLTDAVDRAAAALGEGPEMEQADPSLWLGPDTIDPSLHSITGPAPDTVAVVPPVTLRVAPEPPPPAPPEPLDEPDPTITRTVRAAGSAPTPPPARSTPREAPAETPAAPRPEPSAAEEEEQRRALAEQISMQVLQRIDLFTDTGLKAQLAEHLQPIVARASKELVNAINQHVGQLVRSYIAEAIEREIDEWRGRH